MGHNSSSNGQPVTDVDTEPIMSHGVCSKLCEILKKVGPKRRKQFPRHSFHQNEHLKSPPSDANVILPIKQQGKSKHSLISNAASSKSSKSKARLKEKTNLEENRNTSPLKFNRRAVAAAPVEDVVLGEDESETSPEPDTENEDEGNSNGKAKFIFDVKDDSLPLPLGRKKGLSRMQTCSSISMNNNKRKKSKISEKKYQKNLAKFEKLVASIIPTTDEESLSEFFDENVNRCKKGEKKASSGKLPRVIATSKNRIEVDTYFMKWLGKVRSSLGEDRTKSKENASKRKVKISESEGGRRRPSNSYGIQEGNNNLTVNNASFFPRMTKLKAKEKAIKSGNTTNTSQTTTTSTVNSQMKSIDPKTSVDSKSGVEKSEPSSVHWKTSTEKSKPSVKSISSMSSKSSVENSKATLPTSSKSNPTGVSTISKISTSKTSAVSSKSTPKSASTKAKFSSSKTSAVSSSKSVPTTESSMKSRATSSRATTKTPKSKAATYTKSNVTTASGKSKLTTASGKSKVTTASGKSKGTTTSGKSKVTTASGKSKVTTARGKSKSVSRSASASSKGRGATPATPKRFRDRKKSKPRTCGGKGCFPSAPPTYLDYSAASRMPGSGGGLCKRNRDAVMERIKNVDVVEELTYLVPNECGDGDCASDDDDDCEYYAVCESCGEMEPISEELRKKIKGDAKNKKCETTPVTYSRRQRFNFKDRDDPDEDGPPYPYEGLQCKNCTCMCCVAGLRRNPNCGCKCCETKGRARRCSSFDEHPVGTNPQIRRILCPEDINKMFEDEMDKHVPETSGMFKFDEKKQRFVRVVPRTPSPIILEIPYPRSLKQNEIEAATNAVLEKQKKKCPPCPPEPMYLPPIFGQCPTYPPCCAPPCGPPGGNRANGNDSGNDAPAAKGKTEKR